jgi:hypothetical protein
MTSRNLLFFLLLFSLGSFGQTNLKNQLKYHPKTFEESLTQLDKIFSDSTKNQIMNMTEDDFVTRTNLSTGMWIRNEWLYDRYFLKLIVQESDLKKELIAKGLPTNDDMSSLILRSYHRKLKGQDLGVKQQINNAQQFYIQMNDSEWRKKQNQDYVINYMKEFNVGDTLTKHIYYKRNWLGEPKKNIIIESVVVEKGNLQLKINIVNFGGEIDRSLVYKEIMCKDGECWIDPYQWKQKVK